MHCDVPYTTPDEDPFNIRPLRQQPRRRRSSMLDKWILEQQKLPFAPQDTVNAAIPPRSCSLSNPYLAYPDLGRTRAEETARDDAMTLNSYDLVDDDDIPQSMLGSRETPATPTSTRSRRTSRLLHTPTSFRSFTLSFRSSSPAPPQSLPGPSVNKLSKRISFLNTRQTTGSGRTTPQQHERSSSLSTINTSVITQSPTPNRFHPPSAASRWRPSVLDHFGPTSSDVQTIITTQDPVYTPSRPSISSGDTYTSTTATTIHSDTLSAPPIKSSFMDSIRSRNRSHGSVILSGPGNYSSSSLFSKTHDISKSQSSGNTPPKSGTASSTTLVNRPESTRVPLAQISTSRLANINFDDEDEDSEGDPPKPPKYDPTRPHVAYSSGTLPRVTFGSLSTRGRKKRKRLVISGIGHNESRKFEGVKRWCESFGEVSQITRMPNGDLQVHFRRADVADTVCRLRAKVHISGVGSVQLSWVCDKR